MIPRELGVSLDPQALVGGYRWEQRGHLISSWGPQGPYFPVWVCEWQPGDSWHLGVPAPHWGAMGSEPQPEGMAGASPSENPVFWPLKAEGGNCDSFWQGHKDSSRGVLGGMRE